MAARLVEKSEPDVADLIRGLQLIRVNVIGLDDSNRSEMEKRVKKIRSELDDRGWERIVTAQKKDEDIGVYLKTRGADAVEGVVITVIEGNREAVLINIVGDIKPDKIAEIGERMGGRWQGGAVVGALAVGQFAAPDQGVDRVVVGEAGGEDQQQGCRDRGDPGGGRQPVAGPLRHARDGIGAWIHWPST